MSTLPAGLSDSAGSLRNADYMASMADNTIPDDAQQSMSSADAADIAAAATAPGISGPATSPATGDVASDALPADAGAADSTSQLTTWVGSVHRSLTKMLSSTATTTTSAVSSVYGRLSSCHDAGIRKAMEAEHRLLAKLPFFHRDGGDNFDNDDSTVPTKGASENADTTTATTGPYAITRLVAIDDESAKPRRYINTFMMDNDGDRDFDASPGGRAVVIGHGFGAGLGFWYRNYQALSALAGWRVYSIDWLGMGRSSRTPLPPRRKDISEDEDIANVEAYFVDSLEEWRRVCKIEKMVLVGHSLGGYLSTKYALRYPDRVEKLILASPAGVPAFRGVDPLGAQIANRSFMAKKTYQLFRSLWQMDFSPQGLVRYAGPLGHRFIRGYATARLNSGDAEDLDNIVAYLHGITVLAGSGEYALNRLLAPGAWARRPLESVLPQLKVPVVFMYGEYDWMDPTVPMQMLRAGKLPPGSKVLFVPDAGHQLFLDNVSAFNEMLSAELTAD